MNIAIVEDMEKWAADIKTQTAAFFAEKCETIDIFNCAETFLKTKKEYSIVFMDIELKEMDGFKAAKNYKEQCPESLVIIVTVHKEYCSEGYKVNAFRYLDKGKLREELKEALENAMLKLQRYERIELSVIKKGILTFACKDIIYIETEKRNVKIHTIVEEYISCEKIGELAERLEKYGFYRCHKSYLVNLEWVDDMVRDKIMRENRNLLLKNGDRIAVACKKVNETRKKLQERKFMLANQ